MKKEPRKSPTSSMFSTLKAGLSVAAKAMDFHSSGKALNSTLSKKMKRDITSSAATRQLGKNDEELIDLRKGRQKSCSEFYSAKA